MSVPALPSLLTRTFDLALPLAKTPDRVALSVVVAFATTLTWAVLPSRLILLVKNTEFVAEVEPKINAEPDGTKPPLPQCNNVPLLATVVLPKVTVRSLFVAEKPPDPFH